MSIDQSRSNKQLHVLLLPPPPPSLGSRFHSVQRRTGHLPLSGPSPPHWSIFHPRNNRVRSPLVCIFCTDATLHDIKERNPTLTHAAAAAAAATCSAPRPPSHLQLQETRAAPPPGGGGETPLRSKKQKD